MRPRLEVEEEETDRLISAPSGGMALACSLRNARNSAGAISGWTLAGTQKRWKGSSVELVVVGSVLSDSALGAPWLLRSDELLSYELVDELLFDLRGEVAEAEGRTLEVGEVAED